MIEKSYSICRKCGNKWQKKSRGESYCLPCRTKYNRVMLALRRKHEPPEDHHCDICCKSEDQLSTMFTKGGAVQSKWRLDHCHKTGKFRGWLCQSCNIALGNFEDDPKILKKAISYLIGDKL